MGYLVYGLGTRYQFDDRVLAHLKIVMGSKLRRQESFYLTWTVGPDQGSGQNTLWVSPSTPLQFAFQSKRPPTMNKAWLEAMANASHGPNGLFVITEEEANPSPAIGGKGHAPAG